jgi:hypothetical protein
MDPLIQSVVPLGTSGVLLVLLIRSHLKQGDSWEQIVRNERETAKVLREELAEVRREFAAEREQLRKELADLHRRLQG